MNFISRLRRKWIVASRLRTRTIRARLMLVVVALVIPGWLGMAAVIYGFYQHERDNISRNAVSIAHALMTAVERDLAVMTTVAQVFAATPLLASDDFEKIHREASKLLRFVIGSNFVLSDASDQQLVNTIRPYGEPLPFRENSKSLRKVFETGRPIVSDVYEGKVVKRHLIAIDVPVFRGNEVKYTLAVGLNTERLNELLNRQKLPANWVAAILDTAGVVVARTHSPERYVGKPGTPELLKSMTQTSAGVVETTTLEGLPSFAAFSRSEDTRWTAVIGIPVAELTGGLNKLLLIGSAGALFFLIIGLALAGYQANRIARAVQDLIPPALALGRGEVPNIPWLRVSEANDVAEAIERASQLLQNRTIERDSAKDKKDAAEAAASVMDEFVATVSHELRTPLTSIAASLGLLAGGTGGALPPAPLRLVTIAHANTQRLVRLINDILDIGKINSGKMAFDLAAVDLRTIAEPAIEANHALAQERSVSIHLDAGASGCVVCADADRLTQVVANLLSNAIKFSPPGETVVVLIEQRAAMGRVSVRDHGPGIPEEFKAHIFEKFAQAGAGDTRQRGGTGLGLNIVQKIVTQHGGSVSFEAAPGGGTIFAVEIPLWAEATRAA